ncbi:MAG: cation:proton antiporter [Pseudorhodoplanes sp.]
MHAAHITFFESLLLLLLTAIALMQVSRRTSIPYPSMLAVAGIAAGFVPGTPKIDLDPQTLLALFIAPALVDAAFDFPLAAIKRLWRPLIALAVVAVLLTTAAVGWIGWAMAGLPLAAAIALGAIVAPPDAAASAATLRSAALPRRTMEVLKGESLLNDGTALLIFGCAVAIQVNQGFSAAIGAQLAIAVPGGMILGIVLARVMIRFSRYVRGTLGGRLLEFVGAFSVWIIAERLGLSAVLCIVTFAMTIARSADVVQTPRVRVHSYAIWETVVFLLNVIAFLLMGMQARSIIAEMPPDRLSAALVFAAAVILAVVVVRLVWVFAYIGAGRKFPALRGDLPSASFGQALLIGWCGMRGLVTLATAFALPNDFPERDLIVLAAFGVVIATVVVQGITIAPLIRLLGINAHDAQHRELVGARKRLADAALRQLADEPGAAESGVARMFEIERDAWSADGQLPEKELRRTLMRKAIDAQRVELGNLQQQYEISEDTFLTLQQELDWKQLSLSTADAQAIEET